MPLLAWAVEAVFGVDVSEGRDCHGAGRRREEVGLAPPPTLWWALQSLEWTGSWMWKEGARD